MWKIWVAHTTYSSQWRRWPKKANGVGQQPLSETFSKKPLLKTSWMLKKHVETDEMTDKGEANYSTCYKESVEHKLKKLMPGATAGVHALLVKNKLITGKEEIDAKLRCYWQKVFKKQAPSKNQR